MAKLDPWPWVKAGEESTYSARWGSEYPKYDGIPVTYLNLVFSPRPGYCQDRSEYPDHPWTEAQLQYYRGFYAGMDWARELMDDD